MPPRVRLVDVAARAGVSTATASLVLRNRPGPGEAARTAVRRAADDLGYRVDRTASLLARRRTHLLGVLLDVTSTFHAEVVGALDAVASGHGLDLVLATVTPARDEQSAVETLLDSRCEGLVLLGQSMTSAALDAVGAQCPTVAIGRPGTRHVHGVRAADDLGLAMAVDHLVAFGHTRLTYVDGPTSTIASSRRRGFHKAVARLSLADSARVIRGGGTEADGVRAARVILALPLGDRPTAVIAFNDRVAVGLHDAFLRAGLQLPGAMSLVGYDDSPLARLATVDLTSVSQDPQALAEATVRALVARLSGADDQPRTRDDVILPRLVVRGSTVAPD